MHGGKYPDSLETLTVSESDDEDPLLEGGIIDPYGNELRLTKRGGKKRPLITSAGPDGEFDTEDDITNVDAKKK